MDGLFGLPRNTLADVQVFRANSYGTSIGWSTWRKRPGANMVSIFAVSAGGKGGNGVVGANSTAAGGGGGGSSGQAYLIMPANMLPDTLFVSVMGGAGASAGNSTYVAVTPNEGSVYNLLIRVQVGGAGGNASGATAGAAGGAGTIPNVSSAILGGMGQATFLAGQAGIIGGTTVAGTALTLPTTGLRVTGGTGGGGLPAAATVGTAGGSFTVGGILPLQSGGIGATGTTTPGGAGSNGFSAMPGAPYGFFYGGTGGGSSHGSATGAGLVGGNGGDAGYGCGGGGGGGALTGSAQGLGGRGGDGLVIIVQW